MSEDFGHTMDEITYMAARFVKYSEEAGALTIDWRQVGFYFAATKTMILSFIILIYCGIAITKTIRKDLKSLRSKERLRLELNLFLALIVQVRVLLLEQFFLIWHLKTLSKNFKIFSQKFKILSLLAQCDF